MSFLRARRLFSTVSSGSTLPSLTRGLFRGHLATESVYPYPPQDVMNAEEGETLKMLVEPSRHFFSKVNDAAANDENASIPEKTYAGLRELGAYGMQVSVTGEWIRYNHLHLIDFAAPSDHRLLHPFFSCRATTLGPRGVWGSGLE